VKYTVRYAHLAQALVKVGQALKEGDLIGIMGNTGQSYGAHLHIDCVRGRQTKKYTLSEIESGKYISEPKQLNYFIDEKLFGSKPVVTTPYCDYDYQRLFRKLHFGYDVIPSSADWHIRWNRSKIGIVSAILDDPAGYGNCVYITFEA